MRYYVIADPHGFYTEMVEALKRKGFFDDEEPHKLIICGDLFDRGNEATKMQRFISQLIDEDKVILIKGNHEELLLDFIEHTYKYSAVGLFATHHYRNGTINTCEQLTLLDYYEMEVNPACVKNEMDKTMLISKIIPRMVDYFETNNYIFVHGWIPCIASGYGGKANTYKYRRDWRTCKPMEWQYSRWYNGIDAANQGAIEPNKTIVCGHWHASYGHSHYEGRGQEFGLKADFSPYYADGIIALDACTVESRKVNCIIIED